jgi:GTP-binding protein
MPVPNVAIVGRPNVGKSSLLNAVAGRRVSIVEPTAGVTRDRVSVEVEWEKRIFELVDTGGLGLVDESRLEAHIQAQIEVAMHEADVLIFVVDAKTGLGPMDESVARRVRKVAKPTILVMNKVEGRRDEFVAQEAYKLGFGEPLYVSAVEGTGISDMLSTVVEKLPEQSDAEEEPALRFAIVGKRNSGKSTLTNLLAGKERVIVSEIPGTTRDAVDVRFERDGKPWVAIDTAGLRKKSSVQDAIEFFSLARSERSVRRSDVCILLFDMTEEISQVDKKLAHFVIQHYKPCLLVGNKLDLAQEAGAELHKWEEYLREQLPGLAYAPISYISAQDGINVDETLEVVQDLYDQSSQQVSTARLNQVLQAAKQKNQPRDKSGRLPKLYYATQVSVRPPTILVFVNDPDLFTGQYDRYLQNRLREAFDMDEIPIRLVYKRREKVELPPE